MRNASIGASRQFLLGGLTLLTVVAWAQPQITYKIDTLAGQRVVEDGIPAIQAQLNFPEAVAIDGSGNLYIADTNNNSIRKVDPTGMITTVAGTGEYGFSGDGGPAVQAQLTRPIGVAMDSAGNLYIYATDSGGDFLIRKVDSTGTITKVAGPGTPGSSGSSFAFSQAQIARPTGVAVDSLGNLYIADTWDNRIRKIDPTGTITTVAGARGGFSGDGGPAPGPADPSHWRGGGRRGQPLHHRHVEQPYSQGRFHRDDHHGCGHGPSRLWRGRRPGGSGPA